MKQVFVTFSVTLFAYVVICNRLVLLQFLKSCKQPVSAGFVKKIRGFGIRNNTIIAVCCFML